MEKAAGSCIEQVSLVDGDMSLQVQGLRQKQNPHQSQGVVCGAKIEATCRDV